MMVSTMAGNLVVSSVPHWAGQTVEVMAAGSAVMKAGIVVVT